MAHYRELSFHMEAGLTQLPPNAAEAVSSDFAACLALDLSVPGRRPRSQLAQLLLDPVALRPPCTVSSIAIVWCDAASKKGSLHPPATEAKVRGRGCSTCCMCLGLTRPLPNYCTGSSRFLCVAAKEVHLSWLWTPVWTTAGDIDEHLIRPMPARHIPQLG